MSKYTTGEIAKLCGVTVRTVQYYDTRSILVPSELSEGGRRLYSEEDLKKMKLICFLREMGFSIDHIGQLFSEASPEKLISMLIEQQEQTLSQELAQTQEKLDKLASVKRSLKSFEKISVQNLGDIAQIMKNQRKHRRVWGIMIALGLLTDAIEVGMVVYGIQTGIWWPLMVGIPVVIGLGIYISWFYVTHVDYICPECHTQFRPGFREMFWASHTITTRRLTCPHCGHKGFCLETYREVQQK